MCYGVIGNFTSWLLCLQMLSVRACCVMLYQRRLSVCCLAYRHLIMNTIFPRCWCHIRTWRYFGEIDSSRASWLFSVDQHPHFACCDHPHRSILSLCTGPDTTRYGCRVYSWTISRRMASRGEVVLSLGNTSFAIRAQCYIKKQDKMMICLWTGNGGLFHFFPLGVQ